MAETISFYLFAALAVGASALVIGQRNPMYSVMLLIASFGALSGLYILLDAPFVAIAQIIIYAGAIMPALNGFIGEFLTMLGAFLWEPRFVVVAGLGVILSAVYMLWMFQRVYLGEVTNPKNTTLPDLRPREWASVVPLCAIAIVMGVFPALFLSPMESSVQKVVERLHVTQPVTARVERAR